MSIVHLPIMKIIIAWYHGYAHARQSMRAHRYLTSFFKQCTIIFSDRPLM